MALCDIPVISNVCDAVGEAHRVADRCPVRLVRLKPSPGRRAG